MLDGKTIGWATEVSGREEVELEPIRVVGKLAPIEYAETGYTVSLRAGFLRLDAQALNELDLAPHTANDIDIITQRDDITAMLVDRVTNKLLWVVTNVKFRSRDFRLDSKGLYSEDVEFVGIRHLEGSDTGNT